MLEMQGIWLLLVTLDVCQKSYCGNYSQSKHACTVGSVAWNDNCHEYSELNCNRIVNEIYSLGQNNRNPESLEILAMGGVKTMYHGVWRGINVVVSKSHKHTMPDFKHGVNMLKSLYKHDVTVPLLGVCDHRNEIVTPFYKFGSADKWDNILSAIILENKKDDRIIRMQACLDLLKAFKHLHKGPKGSHIMCDAKEGPKKLLSQFVVTDNLRLLLNDMDAVPFVNSTAQPPVLAKCGHRQFSEEDFVAPEQLWPYHGEPFNDHRMPGYDEKCDIWRIPDTLLTLLGLGFSQKFRPGFQVVFKGTFEWLYQICQQKDSERRADINSVYKVFNGLVTTAKDFIKEEEEEAQDF